MGSFDLKLPSKIRVEFDRWHRKHDSWYDSLMLENEHQASKNSFEARKCVHTMIATSASSLTDIMLKLQVWQVEHSPGDPNMYSEPSHHQLVVSALHDLLGFLKVPVHALAKDSTWVSSDVLRHIPSNEFVCHCGCQSDEASGGFVRVLSAESEP